MPNKRSSLQACWDAVLEGGCLYVREHDDQLTLTYPESDSSRQLLDLTQKIKGAPDREMGRKLFGLITGLTPAPKHLEFYMVPFFYFAGCDVEASDAFEIAHGLRLSYAKQAASKKTGEDSSTLVHGMMAQNITDERDHFLETDDIFFMEAKIVAIMRK